MNDQQAIWLQLQKSNLVTGELEPSTTLTSPWFIKLLLAFSGWFASLFIFGFFLFTLYDWVDSSLICFAIGSGLIFIAYQILKSNPYEFLEHLMLAFSLAGQALIAWACFTFDGINFSLFPWLMILVIQSLLSLLMPHYVHRVFSAFFACLALVTCLHYLHLTFLASASLLLLVHFLILNEWRHVKWQPVVEAISYGIILLLIPFKASYVLGYDIYYWFKEENQIQTWTYYLDELLLLVAMLYLVITLIRRSQHHFSRQHQVMMIGATICLCLLSMQASGITIGFALLILGFSNSNKVLQGLGIVSLLFYISSYYYLLTLTLLEKTGILLFIGLFILAIRFILLKCFHPTQQGENDAI